MARNSLWVADLASHPSGSPETCEGRNLKKEIQKGCHVLRDIFGVVPVKGHFTYLF